jgi:hypothetical protein
MNYGDDISIGTACFPGQGGVKSKGEQGVKTNKKGRKCAKMADFTQSLPEIERNCEGVAPEMLRLPSKPVA